MIRKSLTALLVATGILFLPRDLQAQNQKRGIHIKERVTISPLAPRVAQSAAADTAAHSIRAVLSASSPTPVRLVVTRESCPGDTELISQKNYDGTGSVTFEITDTKPRVYEFFGQLSPGVTATFSLYTDDSLAYEYQEANPSNPWYPAPFEDFIHAYGEFLPFATDLQLRFLQTCLQSGSTTTVAVPPVYSCSTPIKWSPERNLIHFQVLAGETLGEFRTAGGTPLGTDFQLKYADAQNMRFVANAGLDHGGVVILEATVGDIRSIASLTVFTDKDLSLALSSNGTEVQHGEQIELVGRTITCSGSTAIPPSDLTFTFRIIDGQEWGRLFHEGTRLSSDTLEGIPHDNGEARVWFQAWEDSSTEPEQVTIEMLASDPNISPVTINLSVTPGGIKIVAAPPTLAYGEKSTITVQKLLPDGSTEPLSPEATITYRIVDGMTAGTLQNADSSEYGDEILTSESQWLFAAKEEEPQPDEVEVIVQIEVEEGIIIISGANGQEGPGLQANASKEGHQQITGEKSASTSTFYGLSGVARIKVKKESDFQILLGESKYYYVVEKDGKRRIKETTKPKFPEEEEGETIIKSASVWGDNAVTIAGEEANIGKRLGVYWETQKPKPDGSGNLAAGLVRLVGRYWTADSVYKVKLAANGDEDVKPIVVEVKKPSILYSPPKDWKNGSYSTTVDVFGKPLDVDNLIIEWAGLYGIPPQFVKGQMYREAYKSGGRFNPSYRYEPWADVRIQSVPSRMAEYKKQPFFIDDRTAATLGEGRGLPTDHKNVEPIGYFSKAMKIGKLVTNPTYWDQYAKFINGTLVFFKNPEMTNYWLNLKVGYFMGLLNQTPDQAAASATARIQEEIQEYLTQWAQTRLEASYGFLQLIYMTAVLKKVGYNLGRNLSNKPPTPVIEFDTPEELNDHSVLMPLYAKFTTLNLSKVFGGPEQIPLGNWASGFEETWRDSFTHYNAAPTYPNEVVQYSLYFLPREDK